jgi:hypothetical protein
MCYKIKICCIHNIKQGIIFLLLFFLLSVTACSTSKNRLMGDAWTVCLRDCNPDGECPDSWSYDRERLYIYYENTRSDSYQLFFKNKHELEIILYFPESMKDGVYCKTGLITGPVIKYDYRIDNNIIVLSDPGSGSVIARWRIIKLDDSQTYYDDLVLDEKGSIKKYSRTKNKFRSSVENFCGDSSENCTECCFSPCILFILPFTNLDSLTP